MRLLVDTNALFWWLTKSSRLSKSAEKALSRAIKQGPVFVSAMSIFEIGVLSRSAIKLNAPVAHWIQAACALPYVSVEPVGREIAELAAGISEAAHADPADRIIVATALHLGATLVTSDTKMHEGSVPTLW